MRSVKPEFRTAEETPSVRTGELYAHGRPRPGEPLSLRVGQGLAVWLLWLHVYDDRVEVVHRQLGVGGDFDDCDYVIPVSWVETNLGGGRRAYFRCPGAGCGRRVARLFADGPRLLCRQCGDVRYASQRGRTSSYERLLRRIAEIRARLGGSMTPGTPFPERPKGMHLVTYDRLCVELSELEQLEPEHRRLAGMVARASHLEYVANLLRQEQERRARTRDSAVTDLERGSVDVLQKLGGFDAERTRDPHDRR